MYIDDSSKNIQYPCFPQNRFLSFIKAEAEDILNAWNRHRYFRPSWDSYVPTKYDPPDEACLRIKNIWTYVIYWFLSTIITAGFVSTVFWLPIARYTLLTVEYYIGIVISIIFVIIYLSTRKSLRRFILRITPDRAAGERKYSYIEVGIMGIMLFILFVLQLIWKLPFALFVFYFLLFIAIYVFVIMLIYLIMRLKSNNAK